MTNSVPHTVNYLPTQLASFYTPTLTILYSPLLRPNVLAVSLELGATVDGSNSQRPEIMLSRLWIYTWLRQQDTCYVFLQQKAHWSRVFTKQKVSALPHWVAGRRYEAIKNILVGQILSSRPLLHAAAVSAIGCNREQRPIAEDPFVLR